MRSINVRVCRRCYSDASVRSLVVPDRSIRTARKVVGCTRDFPVIVNLGLSLAWLLVHGLACTNFNTVKARETKSIFRRFSVLACRYSASVSLAPLCSRRFLASLPTFARLPIFAPMHCRVCVLDIRILQVSTSLVDRTGRTQFYTVIAFSFSTIVISDSTVRYQRGCWCWHS